MHTAKKMHGPTKHQHEVGIRALRADAPPSWGRAVVSAGFEKLYWQPSGYALYNRPITSKYKNILASEHVCAAHAVYTKCFAGRQQWNDREQVDLHAMDE